MAITTFNGFVTSDTTLADLVENSVEETTYYKVWDTKAGGVYTEGGDADASGWVTAAGLADMALPETEDGDLNSLYFQGWDPENKSSEWTDLQVQVSDTDSTVG